MPNATTRWGAILLAAALPLFGCTGEFGNVDVDPEVTEGGDPEPDDADGTRSIAANFGTGTRVQVCRVRIGLNCRSGPSTRYRVLRVLPSGKQGRVTRRSGSWHRLDLGNGVCWSYGGYLCKASSSTGSSSGSSSSSGASNASTGSGSSGWRLRAPYHLTRDGIVATARRYAGFSYWWGGARLPNPWATSGKSRGRCYRSTYSGHSGRYGADCSGFVGMMWQLPTAKSFESNSHPYSTYHFYNNRTYWSSVSRGSTRRGDAMVYNSGSGGHMFITVSVSSWGRHRAVEARGCAYGIRDNVRSVSSSYRTRRRKGVR